MTDTSRPENTEHVAIVTGAGSGVGRDAAILLAESGFAVVLVGRTEAKLNASRDLIRYEAGSDAAVLIQPGDVSDPADVTRIFKNTLDKFGRIDAVANIAGSAPLQPITAITDDILDDCLATNLKSVVYMTRAAWPTFQNYKAGVIVNVSSMASLDPFTGFNIYGAAKAGVNVFTKATADEGAKINVRAYAVAPGAIETAMLRTHFPTTMLPENMALDPTVVAAAIRDLILGKSELASGDTLPLPSPA